MSNVTGILKLLDACQNRCLFCAEASSEDSRLSPADARALLERMRSAGADSLVFSGGEPTGHRGLEGLIAHAKDLGYTRIAVFSNGRRLRDDRYTDALASAGLDAALISVHGPDARTHESVVGAGNAFEETLQGIDNLLSHGIDVLINTVVSTVNFQRLEDHVDFIATRFSGRVRLQLSDLFPTTRVLRNPELHVSYRELKPWLGKALIRATCLSLPCCTSLYPLCVLDPFFMDALELREEDRETLVAGDGCGPTRRKPEFEFHRYYLGVCRNCSLRRVCPGIPKSYRMNETDREVFRPFAHLEPEGCLAANQKRDRRPNHPGE